MTDTAMNRRQWNCATIWPPSAQAQEALAAGYRDGWSEIHGMSAESRSASHLRQVSRTVVAKALGTSADNVIFATDYGHALGSVMKSVALARSRTHHRVVHSAIEHSSVHHIALELTTQGMSADVLPVNTAGQISCDALQSLLESNDIACCVVQWTNAEIGTIQNLEAIHALTTEAEVPLIVDATAAIGYLSPPQHWDVLVACASAFGGPQTCSVIAKRAHVRLDSRPGATVNELESAPECVATAVALQHAQDNQAKWAQQAASITSLLREVLAETVDDVDIVANQADCAPHILTISALYCDGETLVRALDNEGFNVGSGSACSSSRLQPSHVLAACNRLTHGNIRIGIAPAYSHDAQNAAARFATAYRDAVVQIRSTLS